MGEPVGHNSPPNSAVRRDEQFIERAMYWHHELQAMEMPAVRLDKGAKNRIRDELNELCPYTNQEVIMTGNAIIPTFDAEGKLSDALGSTRDVLGRCLGVKLLEVPQGEQGKQTGLVIMYKLLTNHEQLPSPTLYTTEDTRKTHYYFMLGSLVLPISDIESAFSNPDVHNAHAMKVLNKGSDELVAYLASDYFHRLSHRRQQQRLDNYIRRVERQINIRSTGVVMSVPFVYAPHLDEQQGWMMEAIDASEHVVQGTCLGIDSLETRLLQYRPIRKLSDMYAADAGLAVVIEPDEESRRVLELHEQQRTLFVPVSWPDGEMTFWRNK